MARLVGRVEIASTPGAAQAMGHEWNRLRNKNVWDENKPRDWADVRQGARREQDGDVHLGHLCGICVEQNSEVEVSYRKYKRASGVLG